MKNAERAALLILLAAASGSADGWSYFGLGHAFVANMTGNTVLLGVSVFHLKSDFLHPLLALTGYVLGTIIGTLMSRRVEPGACWSRSTSGVLFLEALVLIAAEAGWIATRYDPAGTSGLILLECVAVAVGMQSAAMVQLRIPGVATTYITGTWTTLTNGITLLLTRQPAILKQEKKYEDRFELQAGVLAAYFLSAVLAGWAFHHAAALVGAIPATAVLVASAWGALRN